MNRLLRRTAVGVALGILLYVAATLWFGVERVRGALAEFSWEMLAAALALSCVNYGLRFWKWELCLGWLGVRGNEAGDAPNLTRARSLQIYLAGLSMSVTPGKVGEVLRSLLLKASDGVSFARTAPIVVADRLTDLIALVILSLIGVSDFREYLPYVLATLALVLGGVLVLGTPRLSAALLRGLSRLPVIGTPFLKAGAMVESAAVLLGLRPLLILSVISVVGWGMECIGYWLILHGFAGVDASLSLCTFLWAATTLVGALSFLPGGLGATEASLGVLVGRFAIGMTQPIALASTLLIRGATLWWGEIVGAASLALFMRDPKVRARTGEEPIE